jgi:transposase InsO family protein
VLYGLFVIEHERRKILHCNVTQDPTSEWIIQQLREALPEPCRYRYVILDRDRKLDAEVTGLLTAAGLEAKHTRVQSPWQNGLAERWIGSDCREILDHIPALNEEILRRVMRDYASYLEDDRLALLVGEGRAERARNRTTARHKWDRDLNASAGLASPSLCLAPSCVGDAQEDANSVVLCER